MQAKLIRLKKSIEKDVCESVYKHYISFFESLKGPEFDEYKDYIIEYEPINGGITRNKLIKWFNTTLEADEQKHDDIHPEIQVYDCIPFSLIETYFEGFGLSKYC